MLFAPGSSHAQAAGDVGRGELFHRELVIDHNHNDVARLGRGVALHHQHVVV